MLGNLLGVSYPSSEHQHALTPWTLCCTLRECAHRANAIDAYDIPVCLRLVGGGVMPV